MRGRPRLTRHQAASSAHSGQGAEVIILRPGLQLSADGDTPSALLLSLHIQTLGLTPSILDVALEKDLHKADGGGHLNQEAKKHQVSHHCSSLVE